MDNEESVPSMFFCTTRRQSMSHQNATIISAVLAGLSATLLVFVQKTQAGIPHDLLLLCSCGALLLNISATTGALVLALKHEDPAFREPLSAHKTGATGKNSSINSSSYAVGSGYDHMTRHWKLCVMGGAGFLLLQVMIHIYLQKSSTITISMAIISGFALLPLIIFIHVSRVSY